jgi:hypothetical protein
VFTLEQILTPRKLPYTWNYEMRPLSRAMIRANVTEQTTMNGPGVIRAWDRAFGRQSVTVRALILDDALRDAAGCPSTTKTNRLSRCIRKLADARVAPWLGVVCEPTSTGMMPRWRLVGKSWSGS